ncbi:hypothetical protein PAMP_001812 [Pampus punctatissimus]
MEATEAQAQNNQMMTPWEMGRRQELMGTGDRRSSQTPPFHHDGSPSPSDRELKIIKGSSNFHEHFVIIDVSSSHYMQVQSVISYAAFSFI